MNVHHVLASHVVAHLADSLEERCGLDIADGAADLGNNDIGVGLLAYSVNLVLYLVGDVGNYLNCAAEVIAASFLIKNCPVNLACGNVGIDGKIFINKSLVVAEVQICFGAVIGNEYLAVLIW